MIMTPGVEVPLCCQLPLSDDRRPGSRDGSESWVPATHAGDMSGVPHSWLWPGSGPAVVGIWGMPPVDGKSLSISQPFKLNEYILNNINNKSLLPLSIFYT